MDGKWWKYLRSNCNDDLIWFNMIWVVESSSRELLCNSYGDLHRFTTFFWWDLPPSSKFGISLDPTLRMQPYTVLARSCSIHRCKMYHYINYIYIYIVYAHIKYTYHTSSYIYIHILIYWYIDRSILTDWLIDWLCHHHFRNHFLFLTVGWDPAWRSPLAPWSTRALQSKESPRLGAPYRGGIRYIMYI